VEQTARKFFGEVAFPFPSTTGGAGKTAVKCKEQDWMERVSFPFSAEITPEVRGALVGARRAGLTQDAIILQVWGCTKGSNTRSLAAREKYRQIGSEAGIG